MSFQTQKDDHLRTIIHIDIDCFYAQVEMVKDPKLRDLPLGIQQKNIVVTSNYIARNYGIKKCMLVKEALKICPNLTLVNGEDLRDYRQISYQITNHLQKYSRKVERLGLDENFIDVSEIVTEKLKNYTLEIVGHVYGDNETCDCGCRERLTAATHIAKEMRNSILETFNLTTCAGIGHNKLIAKISCGKNKPNQQTVTFPISVNELILNLNSPTDIPGIGHVTGELFKKANINSILDLQNCQLTTLSAVVGAEKAHFIHNLSFGIDTLPVKSSGKPNSIGIEDACKILSVETEIELKFEQLLSRLMNLVADDGRIPRTIKLTVRKHDEKLKVSTKETKQCKISPMFFQVGNKVSLKKDAQSKLMKTIMSLFTRIVDVKQSFHVTLLGLSFTKFLETAPKSNITKFLKGNIQVQSLTNIENKSDGCVSMDCSMDEPRTSEVLESEIEPVPKKTKFTLNLDKNIIKSSDDLYSPSKLRVAELQLNSSDSECTSTNFLFSTKTVNVVPCPPDIDKNVFKELSTEVQQELWRKHVRKFTNTDEMAYTTNVNKPKVNANRNYFVKR